MAYVCLGAPFRPFLGRNPNVQTVDGFRTLCGDDFYICRFQEPGKMEAEFAQVKIYDLLKNILTTRFTGQPIFPKGEYGNGFNPNPSETLPSWLSEDLAYYVAKFEKTGFSGGLNSYRNLNLDWELTAPWTGVGITNVPVKFIIGTVDMGYSSPEVKEYIHNGDGFKKDVPTLEEVVVLEGVAHFINQEAAEDVNNHIYEFIKKF